MFKAVPGVPTVLKPHGLQELVPLGIRLSGDQQLIGGGTEGALQMISLLGGLRVHGEPLLSLDGAAGHVLA